MNWLQKISQEQPVSRKDRPFSNRPISRQRLEHIQRAEELADAHGGYLPTYDTLDTRLRHYMRAFPQYFAHIPRSQENPNYGTGVVEETNVDWSELVPSEWRGRFSFSDLRDKINHLIQSDNVLNSREKILVVKRLGLDGKGKRTFQDLSDEMRLSRERIRDVLQYAFGKLKAALLHTDWDVIP